MWSSNHDANCVRQRRAVHHAMKVFVRNVSKRCYKGSTRGRLCTVRYTYRSGYSRNRECGERGRLLGYGSHRCAVELEVHWIEPL